MVSGVAYAIFFMVMSMRYGLPPPLKKGLPASPKIFLKTRNGIMVTRLSFRLRAAGRGLWWLGGPGTGFSTGPVMLLRKRGQ